MNPSTFVRRLLVLGVLAGFAMGGCMPVSTHQGADLSKAADFHIEKNKTTEKELVDRFGPPGNTLSRGDGTRVLTWNESNGQGSINGTKFIPIVGLFTGNIMDEKITHRSLSATVRDGIVVDYVLSDGNNRMAF